LPGVNSDDPPAKRGVDFRSD